jgi:hypothetical protein
LSQDLFGAQISSDPLATLVDGTAVPVLTPAGTGFSNERTTLAGIRTFLGSPSFNVKASPFNAVGNGIANDLAAVKAARDAAIAVGGGRLFFPSGAYKLEGDGFVNNPANGVIAPIVLEGAGPLASRLILGGITNPEAILLSSQSTMGSGLNIGSGLRHLSIQAGTSTAVLRLSNLEQFEIYNVIIQGGSVALTVSECRLGYLSRFLFRQFGVTGLKIIGELFSDNNYSHGYILSTVATSHIVDYTRTTTAVVAGPKFTNITLNGTGADGFHFEAPSLTNLYVNMTSCEIDDGGSPLSGNAMTLKNVGIFDLCNCFLLSHGSAKAALECDGVASIHVVGGRMFTNTGACADLSLKNTCTIVRVMGSDLSGPTQAVKVDGTVHDAVIVPCHIAGAVTINDATKATVSKALIEAGDSGTYTPTTFLVTNADSATVGTWWWSRRGNRVDFSGRMTIDPTAGSTFTQVGFSLPVASNFASIDDLAGTSCSQGSVAGAVYADPTNDRGEHGHISTGTTPVNRWITGSYLVK